MRMLRNPPFFSQRAQMRAYEGAGTSGTASYHEPTMRLDMSEPKPTEATRGVASSRSRPLSVFPWSETPARSYEDGGGCQMPPDQRKIAWLEPPRHEPAETPLWTKVPVAVTTCRRSEHAPCAGATSMP